MGKYQKNIEAARSVTIMQYLATCHPGELVRKTDDEYCTKTHSSLVITPSKDLFHWFSQNIGGRSALDYMTNVERVDFVSAVRFLNNLTPVPVSSQMAKMPTPTKQQKALLGLLGMAMNRTEPISIGRYKGFDLQIAYFAMDKMYLAYLVGSGINPVQLGADAVGNTMRLDNCLHNLPQSVTDLESKLVQLQKQLENAKEQLAQPFAQADELAEKSKRLAELEALLNLNEKDIVLDTVPDEDQPCRSDNRQRGQER